MTAQRNGSDPGARRPHRLEPAETGPPSAPTRRVRVRLETPAAISPWFGWATVGARGIEPLARAARLEPRATIATGGRWFVRLERAR